MKAFLAYGAASAVLLVVLVLLVTAAVEAADAGSVRLAAAIAWPVQLAAFAALVKGRQGLGFVAAWGSGMALRLVAVGAAALWVTQVDGHDPAALLVSLVGFVMVLVLMEPLFLRLTD